MWRQILDLLALGGGRDDMVLRSAWRSPQVS